MYLKRKEGLLMTIFNVVVTVIAASGTILSITFAILAFGRNKSNDNAKIQSRLSRIETDIVYIRLTLDESKDWRKDFDERLRKLEKGGK
jgi:Flp pilus assembly protein TadB